MRTKLVVVACLFLLGNANSLFASGKGNCGLKAWETVYQAHLNRHHQLTLYIDSELMKDPRFLQKVFEDMEQHGRLVHFKAIRVFMGDVYMGYSLHGQHVLLVKHAGPIHTKLVEMQGRSFQSPLFIPLSDELNPEALIQFLRQMDSGRQVEVDPSYESNRHAHIDSDSDPDGDRWDEFGNNRQPSVGPDGQLVDELGFPTRSDDGGIHEFIDPREEDDGPHFFDSGGVGGEPMPRDPLTGEGDSHRRDDPLGLSHLDDLGNDSRPSRDGDAWDLDDPGPDFTPFMGTEDF